VSLQTLAGKVAGVRLCWELAEPKGPKGATFSETGPEGIWGLRALKPGKRLRDARGLWRSEARPDFFSQTRSLKVHLIIMIKKWSRTGRLSEKNSLSTGQRRFRISLRDVTNPNIK